MSGRFIDANENPTLNTKQYTDSIWINTQKGYVIINAGDSEILHTLENAICEGIGNNIANLIITVRT